MEKPNPLKELPETSEITKGAPSSNGGSEQESPAAMLLSRREIEIAELVSLGLSDKEVAKQLHLTEGTVGWYLNEIFKKWQIHSRTMLAVQFLRDMGPRIPKPYAPNERQDCRTEKFP
jgi:DNA-binding NarL/FixJ family response regulator